MNELAPVEWRNKRGKSLWQPRAFDDSRLWVSLWLSEPTWRYDGDTPYLCSYRRALRLARRENRRMEQEQIDDAFEEVRP